MGLKRVMAVPQIVRWIVSHPLNRRRPMRALARFAAWQMGWFSRRGKVRTFSWINGAKLRIGQHAQGLTGNVYCGLHDFPDMGFLLCYLRPTDLMVDIGANEGEYTILGGVVNGAKVVSIEPIPGTFEKLSENVAINKAQDRVQCLRVGIGDKRETLRFTRAHNTINHVLSEDEQCDDFVEVPVETLDGILQGRCPSLMKIDVEGFEMPALRGAAQTLGNTRLEAIIVELNGNGERYGYSDEMVCRLLTQEGFSSYRFNPFGRELARIDPPAPDYTGNAIFIRNPESVKARIAEHPPIRILGNEF